MASVKALGSQGQLQFSVRKTRNSTKKTLEGRSENRSPNKVKSPIKISRDAENSYSLSPEKRKRLNNDVVSSPNATSCRSPLSPVKIMDDNSQSRNDESIPKKSLFKQEVNIYQQTKAVLSVAPNLKLHCREKEIGEMSEFLNVHLDGSRCGCLYISGAPGTGKTACMEHVIGACEKKCSRAVVNCANLKDPQSIYEEIWCQLNKKNKRKLNEYCKAVEELITTSKESILIVLDELDYLEIKDQSILYTIFQWSSLVNSKLVLIGLANALDLTARVLPRLHSYKCRPTLLHFQPYTKEQISTILHERLKMVPSQTQSVIQPMAVEFCARKVASVAGDVRKALDVCRRAVELVEAEIYQQRILKPFSAAEGNATCLKKVELPMVVAILNDVYGNSLANRNESDENSLPLQQRILLGTLLLLIKHTKSKEITLGKFSDVYSQVCKLHQASKVDQAEFVSICHLVESRGLLHIKYHKDVRQSKVSLRVNEAEIEFALQDKLLLASILRDSAHILQKKRY